MKLLIVDDEAIIRNGIKKLIDFDSLAIDEVFEAANGEKAYTLFMAERPQIILADINMPKMNGLEFSEKVKGICKETKIALITGYDYFDYAQKAVKIGVEDYILKPVSREDIRQLLLKLTREVREEAGRQRVDTMVESYRQDFGTGDDEGYRSEIVKAMEAGVEDSDFSMAKLAGGLGLSVGYTSGLFKKYFELSFKEYLLRKRMEKAKILLLSTDMKHYEISEAVGFNDPNYFSTAFRKYADMSPGSYREKVREGR